MQQRKPEEHIKKRRGEGGGSRACEESWGAGLLVAGSPPAALVLAFWGRGEEVTAAGALEYLTGSRFSWTLLAATLLWAFLWTRFPHRTTRGPRDPDGSTPVYPDNFWVYFCATTASVLGLAWGSPELGARIYKEYHTVMGSGAVFGLLLSIYFFLEGLEVESDLPWLFRFFAGVRFRLNFFGVDAKLLMTYTHTTMAWHALNILFYYQSLDNYGFNLASFLHFFLMMMYMGRIFWWGRGMLGGLDMAVEHLGFYNAFGCFGLYLPLYLLPTLAIVEKAPVVPDWLAVVLGLVGVVSNFLAYEVDREKLELRSGKREALAAEHIRAKWADSEGRAWESLLLVDGFWAKARHLNYTFEFLLLSSTSLLAAGRSPLPLLFLLFLFSFFVQRAFRDEEKCSKKYGRYWDEYCARVPYRLVPSLF